MGADLNRVGVRSRELEKQKLGAGWNTGVGCRKPGVGVEWGKAAEGGLLS